MYEKTLKYLKENKQKLFNLYFDDKFLHNPKIAIFTPQVVLEKQNMLLVG